MVAHERDEAARAVAALLDLAAIGVEDPVAEVDAGTLRPLDDEDLIAADPEPPVGKPPVLRRGEVHLLPDAVEHDEVVAEAVHLGEAELRHRSLKLRCAHGRPKRTAPRFHPRYPRCVPLNAPEVRWSSIFARWVAVTMTNAPGASSIVRLAG